ncbi:MAG: RHS repeat protein, partial [Bacteroidales bacterium]|nr:RHS repeat protein [Bacteroidales bacterium]
TSPLSGCLSPAQISSIKTAAPDALVSIYEYKPMVGLSKVVQPSGEVLTYRYNSTGKLMGIYNTKGEKVEENLYSPDNKQ